uniref:Heme attachment to plastid cytochrome c n=1 Tax=Trentepohlia odorata TaxID=2576626 RepID=A0A4Y5P3J2_9CHLO|nr:Heme attachment to plastid cytochrome c [Trentepohlia odorata]QCW57823.1 Heme attachment to plastid cytochrome c [Trentepohlia odorata]
MHVSIMICSYTTFIVSGLISLILLIQNFFFSNIDTLNFFSKLWKAKSFSDNTKPFFKFGLFFWSPFLKKGGSKKTTKQASLFFGNRSSETTMVMKEKVAELFEAPLSFFKKKESVTRFQKNQLKKNSTCGKIILSSILSEIPFGYFRRDNILSLIDLHQLIQLGFYFYAATAYESSRFPSFQRTLISQWKNKNFSSFVDKNIKFSSVSLEISKPYIDIYKPLAYISRFLLHISILGFSPPQNSREKKKMDEKRFIYKKKNVFASFLPSIKNRGKDIARQPSSRFFPSFEKAVPFISTWEDRNTKTQAWQQFQNKTNQLILPISKKGGDFNMILDNLSYRMFGIGFPLFTLGLLSGAVWANSAWGSYWSWDIKEVGSFIHWLVLTFYFHCRYKNYITFSHLVGFISLIVLFFNFFGVSLGIYGSSLHAYS